MPEITGRTSGIHDFPELMTAKQAADFMHVSNRLVERMCERGDLKAVKVGRSWRIHRNALATQLGL